MSRGKELRPSHKQHILCLAFASKQFGYVAARGTDNLMDWGLSEVRGNDKLASALNKIQNLITHYQPDLICLQDISDPECQLGQTASDMITAVMDMAQRQSIHIKTISKADIRKVLHMTDQNDKYTVLSAVRDSFPDMNLPVIQKRNVWDNEAYVTPCLIAASFLLCLRSEQANP